MEQSRDNNGGPRPTGWQSATDVANRDPWRQAPGDVPEASEPAEQAPTTPVDAPPTAALEPTVEEAQTGQQPQVPADSTQEQPAVNDTRALPFAGSPDGPFDVPPSSPVAKPDRPKQRRAALVVAGLLVAALAGGAAGAGVTAALDDDSPQAPATSSLANPASNTSSNNTDSAPVTAVEEVAAAVMPSVVSISVSTSNGSGTGTGVVISSDGNILTNNHVVQGAGGGNAQLVVTFSDGTSARAEVVGTDPTTDLAVIHVDRDDLTPATFGNSSELRVGQQVVAIGSPLGLDGTVTQGIVSSLDRPVRAEQNAQDDVNTVIDAIQTDAAINPGNSGGALVNLDGEVVGINTAIASLSSGGGEAGSIGLGFAIPIDQARAIADELIDSGEATHALLGVSVGDARTTDSLESGALIRSVTGGGAAAEAGLQEGDIVKSIDGRAIPDSDSLVAAVRSHRPGDSVDVVVQRGGNEQTVQVTLDSDAAQS